MFSRRFVDDDNRSRQRKRENVESEYTREIQLSDTFHHRREIEGVRETRVRDLEKLNAAVKKTEREKERSRRGP